jgi:hypothetical protein
LGRGFCKATLMEFGDPSGSLSDSRLAAAVDIVALRAA